MAATVRVPRRGACARPGRSTPRQPLPPRGPPAPHGCPGQALPRWIRFVGMATRKSPWPTVARQALDGAEPEKPSPGLQRPGTAAFPGRPRAALRHPTPRSRQPRAARSPPCLGHPHCLPDRGRPASWEASLGAGGTRGCGGCSGERRRLASPDGIRRGEPQMPAPLLPARRPAPGPGDPTAHLAAPIPAFPCFLGPADTTRGCEVVDRPRDPAVGGAVGPEVQASVLVRLLSAQPPPW